jgi:hypothetical protein
VLGFSCVLLASLAVSARAVTVFGPERCVRQRGSPTTCTYSFTAIPGEGVFHAVNGEENGTARLTSARILLNGRLVASPPDFRHAIDTLVVQVDLLRRNRLTIELASTPGTFLTIRVLQEHNFELVPAWNRPEASVVGLLVSPPRSCASSTAITAADASLKSGFLKLDIFKADPKYLYAAVQSPPLGEFVPFLGFYRSADEGNTWQKLWYEYPINGYNDFIRVHPTRRQVYWGGVKLFTRSVDLYAPWQPVRKVLLVHDDMKDLVFLPKAPDYYYSLNDGGIWFCRSNVPIGDQCVPRNTDLRVTMFYDIDTGDQHGLRTIGGTQDNRIIITDDGVDWRNALWDGDGSSALLSPNFTDTMWGQSIDVRGARRSRGTSIRRRCPSGLTCGVAATPLGGKGSRCGTPLSKAVPLGFTGTADTSVPIGAALKTISRSMRHCGQLPRSFETCHLPPPNDGWPVCPDTWSGRTKTCPPLAQASQRMSGEKTPAHSLPASPSMRCGVRSLSDSAHRSYPLFGVFSVW